jgi:hypothetical protein
LVSAVQGHRPGTASAIVAIDSKGRTNFSMLKTGIASGMPLKFHAFDLLEVNGIAHLGKMFENISDAKAWIMKNVLRQNWSSITIVTDFGILSGTQIDALLGSP